MHRRAAVMALWIAGATAIVTGAATVLTVLRFAAFRPLAHPFTVVCAAAVVALFAVRHVMRDGPPRVLVQVLAGFTAVTMAAVGLAWDAIGGVFVLQHPAVVATGAGVQVVAWHDPSSGHAHLRLRSRAGPRGLLSRDGTADLAFLDEPLRRELAFATVTGDALVVRTSDGREGRVTFDRTTLRPTSPVLDFRYEYPD